MITSSTGFGFALSSFIVMVVFERFIPRWLINDPPPPSPGFGPANESDESISQYQSSQLSRKAKRNLSKRTRTARPQISAEQQVEIDRERERTERELEIKDLRHELEARDERHKVELDEHCQENKALGEKLEELRRDDHNLKEKLDSHRQTIETMKHDQQKLTIEHKRNIQRIDTYYNKELVKRDSNIVSLQQSGSMWARRCEAAEKLVQEQVIDIKTLQQEAEKHRAHITELTGVILDSSEKATISRDDDYFSGEFARLAGAIRQWVLRYFDPRDVPELRCQDLPETIAQSLEKTIFRYNTVPDSKIKISRTEIEAVIIQRLGTLIFRSNFLFKIFLWPSMSTGALTGVTGLETQKFRAQTADILVKHNEFEYRFSEGVRMVTEELQHCFSGHAKPGMEGPRLKVLYSIVEQAAKLEIEISRELSPFLVHQISPGTIYLPEFQDDRSGTVDSNDDDDDDDDSDTDDTDQEGEEEVAEELKDQVNKVKEMKEAQRRNEFTVGTALFPSVFRWEFDSTGNIVEPGIIVRKGVVIAIRSETDHGYIAAEAEQAESS